MKSGAFFAMTVGVLGLMGGLFQINRSGLALQAVPGFRGSQPDFYMMWTDGPGPYLPAVGLYPFGHDSRRGGVALTMGLIFVLLIAYPFLESGSPATTPTTTCCSARVTYRSAPRIGAMAIAFYMVLTCRR